MFSTFLISFILQLYKSSLLPPLSFFFLLFFVRIIFNCLFFFFVSHLLISWLIVGYCQANLELIDLKLALYTLAYPFHYLFYLATVDCSSKGLYMLCFFLKSMRTFFKVNEYLTTMREQGYEVSLPSKGKFIFEGFIGQ